MRIREAKHALQHSSGSDIYFKENTKGKAYFKVFERRKFIVVKGI